jgi:thymidylate kinase
MCFVALEGPSFSGKTTQTELLVGRLQGQGHDVLHLKFPSKSPAGRAACHLIVAAGTDPHESAIIRACMAADYYTAAPAIRAHLAKGGLVIVDRWVPSSLIYGEIDGLDPHWLQALHHDLPSPDLSVLLRTPFDELLSRGTLLGLGCDRYENATSLRIAHEAYDRLWSVNAGRAWIRVEGDQLKEKVTADILARITHFIRARGF